MKQNPLVLVLARLIYGAVFVSNGVSIARDMDGFNAYCTSNLDGTGTCFNEEDGKAFTCLVVPGALISCPSKKGSVAVECIWIGDVQANQGQFWCDREDELAMYGEDNRGKSFESPAIRPNKIKPDLINGGSFTDEF